MTTGGRRLHARFTALIVAVIAISLLAYLATSTRAYDSFAEDKALTEARMLNLAISSAWDYLDASQDAINYNSDGSYDFKHIYCAIAGKSIAGRITQQSDGYTVRYAREKPRSGTDEPDFFEAQAIGLFKAGESTEFFQVGEFGGQQVLRYAARLDITANCLDCHGEPAGTKDETGFIREGMSMGDLAGVTSIAIPLGPYRAEARNRALQALAVFAFLTVATVAAVRLGLRKWVERPLEQANTELEKVNQAQSDFLATMSHELRTPLSSIIAFTDLWEREADGASPHEQELVQEVKQNSRTLLGMVNNTIDAAKMDAGLFEVHLEETDLIDVITSSIATVDSLAKRSNISIERDIAPDIPLIETDPAALHKVLSNLLSNAVRFSPAGGRIKVAAHAHDKAVLISVSDDGPGIPPSQHEQIFERFKQAEGERTGSGLGLYIAKTTTEKLGGEIRLKSAQGEGSTFTVAIPAHADARGGISEVPASNMRA